MSRHGIQPKLRLGAANDPAEAEADRVADRVMRMPLMAIRDASSSTSASITAAPIRRLCPGGESELQPMPVDDRVQRMEEDHDEIQLKRAPDTAQRLCPHCAAERDSATEEPVRRQMDDEEERVQTKRTPGGAAHLSSESEGLIVGLGGGGAPLPASERAFFEPRFGRDFSEVRIHDGPAAAAAARSIDARAFTLGSDIAFAPGEFSPGSSEGRRLIAHELAHVDQQQGRARRTLRRMTIGRGSPPSKWVERDNAREVPPEDRARVEKAIDMIREVANDPGSHSSCHDYFRDHCPNGTETSMADAFANAVLWKSDRKGSLAYGDVSGNNIVYTQSGYNRGARRLAVTLVHEMFHNCGVSSDEEHHLAEVAGLYCIGRGNEVSVSLGVAFNADMFYAVATYRRFLAGIGNGQIQLTAGADLNLAGLAAVAADKRMVSEVGSGMIGFRGRLNLFGGERFGGLGGRLETGFGLGRFKVRNATDDSIHRELGAGFIVQAGLGAEFYIPGPLKPFPMSLEATYRLVQPLTPQAERIHGLLGNIGFRF